jgi:hypothetical protein
MRKLALLFLVLPLAACATSQQTADAGNCDPRWPGYDACAHYDHVTLSHWDVVSGRGAFLASLGDPSPASNGPIHYRPDGYVSR